MARHDSHLKSCDIRLTVARSLHCCTISSDTTLLDFLFLLCSAVLRLSSLHPRLSSLLRPLEQVCQPLLFSPSVRDLSPPLFSLVFYFVITLKNRRARLSCYTTSGSLHISASQPLEEKKLLTIRYLCHPSFLDLAVALSLSA